MPAITDQMRESNYKSDGFPFTPHVSTPGVPAYEETTMAGKTSGYCLLIPVINEGDRIIGELERAKAACLQDVVDICICDGGSTDGSMEPMRLAQLGVNTLLTKTGPGKQGAQLRMGISWALERGYEGVVTVDGNGKDSVECVPLFVDALMRGYGLVQGSRFAPGGAAVNTPISRLLALKLIHAPVISLGAGFRYTDTTNAFRGYSAELLRDPRVAPLRDVFQSYELLAYLSVRAPRLGYRVCEVPVVRAYPKRGKTPTKISPVRGNIELMRVLLRAASGGYAPEEDDG